MWRHYRCKRCGRVIYIDPGEKRLCEDAWKQKRIRRPRIYRRDPGMAAEKRKR